MVSLDTCIGIFILLYIAKSGKTYAVSSNFVKACCSLFNFISSESLRKSLFCLLLSQYSFKAFKDGLNINHLNFSYQKLQTDS